MSKFGLELLKQCWDAHRSIVFRILVQAGADINAPCGPRGECRTPLHVAAEHGHVANIQVESKSPSEPYYRDRYCVVCNMYIRIVQGCGTVFADQILLFFTMQFQIQMWIRIQLYKIAV